MPADEVDTRRIHATGRDRFTRLAALSLGVAAAIVCGAFLATAARDGTFAFDLRHAFLPAVADVLHGRSPYPAVSAHSVRAGQAYVYPPLASEVLAPLDLVPDVVAGAVFTLLLALAIVLTLRVLGVRDLRCYAVAFLWGPVLASLQTANLTPLIGLAAAAFWRYRRDDVRGPIALALAVTPKLLAWPLLIWAAAAGRVRVATRALVLAVAVTLVSWAAIGFAGFTSYPRLVRHVTRLERGDSYSLYGLVRELGAGSIVGTVVWLVAAASLLALVVVVSRRDERRGFVLAIAATLALTPIIWLHYFALLLVPLAVSRPRFDAVWLLPAALIGASGTGNGGLARLLLALVVAVLVILASLYPGASLRAVPQAVGRLRTTMVRSL